MREPANVRQEHGETLADVVTALGRVEKRISMSGPRPGQRRISDLTTRDIGGLIGVGFWIAVGSFLLGCTVAALYWLVVLVFLGGASCATV